MATGYSKYLLFAAIGTDFLQACSHSADDKALIGQGKAFIIEARN
jgi:hypothetical protein